MMKTKMWAVMDEYIYVCGVVEVFERAVIDAIVALFQKEMSVTISKYEWETYAVPRGCNAGGMCVFSWVDNYGNLDHEAFYYA